MIRLGVKENGRTAVEIETKTIKITDISDISLVISNAFSRGWNTALLSGNYDIDVYCGILMVRVNLMGRKKIPGDTSLSIPTLPTYSNYENGKFYFVQFNCINQNIESK